MTDTHYFFFDIDGTIARDNGPPSPATLKALETLKAKGHKIFLCTGRCQCNVYESLYAPGFDGMIYSAGAHVVVEGREEYRFALAQAQLERLGPLLQEHGVTVIWEGAETMWHITGRAPIRLETDKNADCRPFVGVEPGMKIEKFTMYLESEEMYRRVEAQIGEEFELYPNMRYSFCEVVARGQTKVAGMRRILARYGAPAQRAVVFGDSLNDRDIIEGAGTGVAMGDSPPGLKQAADYVTHTVEQDGVSHALRHLGYVE